MYKVSRLVGASLLAAGWMGMPGWAQAEQKPLWELGLGAGVLSVPDYRGSDESHAYLLPLPYVVDRGSVFKADREGARAEFFDNDTLRLTMTLNASVPVNSRRNAARQGMPNLNGSVEFGPAADVHLYLSPDERVHVKLRVPVSYGLTFGNGVGSNGWQTDPHINLDLRDVAGFTGWNLGLLTGPIYGSRRRHAYFYDVAPAYATPDRPAYVAHGGYGGTQFMTSLSKRFDRYWVGAFVRYDSLQGAAFADSPLVRSKSYLAAGIGVSWVLGQSSDMVTLEQ
jgi:outer membrane protein